MSLATPPAGPTPVMPQTGPAGAPPAGPPPDLLAAAQGNPGPKQAPTIRHAAPVAKVPGQSGSAVSPDTVLQHMSIPPARMGLFTNIVKAGMTLVLSDKTHHLLLEALQGPAPISTKLADGVLNLMGILNHQAKGALPPDLFVPAAVYLLAKIANFINQAGLAKIAPQDVAQAMQILVHNIMQAAATKKSGAGGQPSPAGGPPGPSIGNAQAPGAPPQGGPAPGMSPGAPSPGAGAPPPPGLMAGAQGAPQPMGR